MFKRFLNWLFPPLPVSVEEELFPVEDEEPTQLELPFHHSVPTVWAYPAVSRYSQG